MTEDPRLREVLGQARELKGTVSDLWECWKRAVPNIVAVIELLERELGPEAARVMKSETDHIDFRFYLVPCFVRFAHDAKAGYVEYGAYQQTRAPVPVAKVVERIPFDRDGATSVDSLAITAPGLHLKALIRLADPLFRAYYEGREQN